MFIEIESKGFFVLDIDEETGKDQFGNDQTALLEAVRNKDEQQFALHMDFWVSALEHEYHVAAWEPEYGQTLLELHGW